MSDGLKIRLFNPEHVNISIDTDLYEEDDENEQGEDEDEEEVSQKILPKLFVFHSLENKRETHMILQEV